MLQRRSWIAGTIALAMICLFSIVSSAASPATSPASGYKVIYSFQGGSDGLWPLSDLAFDSHGNLYGTASYGGDFSCVEGSGCGTVFELERTAAGWNYKVLYSFPGGSDGAFPGAGVIFDSAGNLYGMVQDPVTVFELSPNSKGQWTETVLYSLDYGSDVPEPESDLVIDSRGNLFGTVPSYPGGFVFELIHQPKGTWKEVTLYTFQGPPDGALSLSSPVALDSSGNVWGTATIGGTGICHDDLYAGGCGIAYELTHGSDPKWAENILYNFVRGGGNAVTPSGGFALTQAGHILGTSQGGGDGLGSVFELKKSKKGWDQEVLYSFYGSDSNGPDGDLPVGRLETDSAGALLGVTEYGGKNGLGTILELHPSRATGWTETVLHSFAGGSDGSYPAAGVVVDFQGHLYGTTWAGGTGTACGSYGCGTVYEITVGQ